jgi:hypothetical protein
MPNETMVLGGVVRNSVIIPDGGARLPEGAPVRILLPGPGVPRGLLAEFAAWEQASDEAWAMIDGWEGKDGG